MSYPKLQKGANRYSAAWEFMKGKFLRYSSGGKSATVKFLGISEGTGATNDNFRNLSEAVQLAINWTAQYCKLRKINNGVALDYIKEEIQPNYYIWTFPVFRTALDAASIYVKVWIDGDRKGSHEIWATPVSMYDIASQAQFKTQVNTAYQFAMKRSRGVILGNFPPTGQ